MTDQDPIDHALAIGRGGLEPEISARDRVWSRLENAFPELTGSAQAAAAQLDGAVQPNAGVVTAGAPAPGFWQLAKATGAKGAACAGLLVAGGFVAGYAMKSSLLDTAAAPPLVSAPGTPLERPSASAMPTPVVLPRMDAPATLATPASTPSPRQAARPAPKSAAKPSTSDLDAELVLLRRAERAIRSDTPELALALLDELDQKHAASPLVQEREATRAMAGCRTDAVDAREKARAFIAAQPQSVYRARVEAVCQLEPTDPENSARPTDAPAPDTNVR